MFVPFQQLTLLTVGTNLRTILGSSPPSKTPKMTLAILLRFLGARALNHLKFIQEMEAQLLFVMAFRNHILFDMTSMG
jgi:hypothetical protein